MHQSWGSYPICFLNIGCLQLVFYPDDVSLWKTNIFFVLVLCVPSWKVWRVWFILWSYFSFGIFYIWFPQSCVDFGFWYNLDNSFACHSHSCECLLGLIGVWSNLYLVWFLEVLCMYIYYMYTLWHAYFSWSNI